MKQHALSRLSLLLLPTLALASPALAQTHSHTVTTTTWTDDSGTVVKKTTVVKDDDKIQEISASNDDAADLLDHAVNPAKTPDRAVSATKPAPPNNTTSAKPKSALTSVPWSSAKGSYASVMDLPPVGQEFSGQCLASFERWGPFLVRDTLHVELVDATTSTSAERFSAMLRAHPTLHYLDMVDCPGTYDDDANLKIGRMIHNHGMETQIPAGGSVRSGAVELFLAGVARHAAPDAQFGVHAWQDETGREPKDYPANSPYNLKYITYYQRMGMTPAASKQFYTLTNSAPSSTVKNLKTSDVARFITVDNNVHQRLSCHKFKGPHYARQ